MRRLAFTLVAFFAAHGIVGCEPHVTTTRARMARELACTEDRTKLRRLPNAAAATGEDAKRVRAHGCGRAATYQCRSDEECWREGPVDDDPNGPPRDATLE